MRSGSTCRVRACLRVRPAALCTQMPCTGRGTHGSCIFPADELELINAELKIDRSNPTQVGSHVCWGLRAGNAHVWQGSAFSVGLLMLSMCLQIAGTGGAHAPRVWAQHGHGRLLAGVLCLCGRDLAGVKALRAVCQVLTAYQLAPQIHALTRAVLTFASLLSARPHSTRNA